jgi:hypothetical protein
MARGVRSARGEIVDFDLLRIKESLGTAPKGSTVKAREDFIDSKFKRRLRRMTETVAAQSTSVTATPTPDVDAAVDEANETRVVEQDLAPKKKIIKKTTD